jgi:uncharacterized protein YceK
MRREIKIKMKFILLPILILFLASSCSSVYTEYYYENGKLIKVTENSVTDFASVSNKNRIVLSDSLNMKLSCSIVDSTTMLPTVELLYENGKKVYISTEDSKDLPEILEKTKRYLNISQNGVEVK